MQNNCWAHPKSGAWGWDAGWFRGLDKWDRKSFGALLSRSAQYLYTFSTMVSGKEPFKYILRTPLQAINSSHFPSVGCLARRCKNHHPVKSGTARSTAPVWDQSLTGHENRIMKMLAINTQAWPGLPNVAPNVTWATPWSFILMTIWLTRTYLQTVLDSNPWLVSWSFHHPTAEQNKYNS